MRKDKRKGIALKGRNIITMAVAKKPMDTQLKENKALKGRNIITMGVAKRSPWILRLKRK
ncbi:MAG: hypothetical protein IPH20_04385 [Bacteroidales bacterium]|nr:hypothetical protein [Bacteroidales bacterium]